MEGDVMCPIALFCTFPLVALVSLCWLVYHEALYGLLLRKTSIMKHTLGSIHHKAIIEIG